MLHFHICYITGDTFFPIHFRWKTDDGFKGYSIQNYRMILVDVVNHFLTDLDEGRWSLC